METQSNQFDTMEPVKQTFPFKLYHTIEWASDSEFSSALSWSPQGNAFVVHDREVVVEHIIPKFFDHKKWRSFVSCGGNDGGPYMHYCQFYGRSNVIVVCHRALTQQTRQLNLWGFKRELRSPDTEGERYHHQYFNRGKLDELQLIQRTEIKRRSSKKQQHSTYEAVQGLSFNQQIAAMTGNPTDGFKLQGATPQQAGDITQGASFLTGLKGQASLLPGVSLPGGGSMSSAFNMQSQGSGQMSNNMMSYRSSSLPPSMQSQMMQSQMMNPQMMQSQMMNPQMMQSQMLQPQQMLMQQQMMRQPQMFHQGYPTAPSATGGNQWNPNIHHREAMLNQQFNAMTSNNMNGMSNMYSNGNMNTFNMLAQQPGHHPSALAGCSLPDGSQHATLVSVAGSSLRGSISSSLTSAPTHIDLIEEVKANEGEEQQPPSQPLPPAEGDSQPSQPVPRAA